MNAITITIAADWHLVQAVLNAVLITAYVGVGLGCLLLTSSLSYLIWWRFR